MNVVCSVVGRVLTCSWPAALSILCLACRVEDDDMDTDVLCLSHRTSSHIQDSCRQTDRKWSDLNLSSWLKAEQHEASRAERAAGHTR